MRQVIAASILALAAAWATSALAQADRYGGVGTYRAPAPPGARVHAQAAPGRVLSWPGKSTPAAPQQQPHPAAYPQPYAAQPFAPQAYPPPAHSQAAQQAAYPSAYQPQPYYAPAPRAPAAPPGSSATAPSGVYPPNTVPPHLASPMAVPPQQAQPLVSNPQLPNSIYAPAPPPAGALGAAPPQQQLAVNATPRPAQAARYYSLHRQFGLSPDRPPAPPPEGQPVELVSSIDSGVGGEPVSESHTRVVPASKAKAAQTAALRDRRGDGAAN